MKLYIKLTEENNFIHVIEGKNLAIRDEPGNPVYSVIEMIDDKKSVIKFGFHIERLIYYKFG